MSKSQYFQHKQLYYSEERSTWYSAARDGGEDVSFEFAPSPTPSPTSQPTSAPAFHDEDSSDCTTNVEEVLVSSIILY